MLDIENSSRESLKSQPHELDAPETSLAPPREGRPEMVLVIGIVALASMIFGVMLGLLF